MKATKQVLHKVIWEESSLPRRRRMHSAAACAICTMHNVTEPYGTLWWRYRALWGVMEALWNVTERYGSVTGRFATIHFLDRETDRPTDGLGEKPVRIVLTLESAALLLFLQNK